VPVAAAWGGAALLAPRAAAGERGVRAAALGAGAALVAWLASPAAVPVAPLAPGESLLAVESTAAGVVSSSATASA
jgi:hypothetical protein